MADLMDMVAGNLQQRIGEMVSKYEVDMAILRAQASNQLEEKDAQIKALTEEVEGFKATLDVVAADVQTEESKPARTRK